MKYRDDREALRARVDGLEQDLARAKEELESHKGDDTQERVDRIERQMTDARRIIDELGRELEEVRGPRPKPPRAALLGAVALLAALGAAMVVGLRPSPPPAPIVPVPLPPDPIATAPAVPAPISPAEEVPVPVVRRTATAVWPAKVARVTGAGPAVGSSCTATAKLQSEGASIRIADLTITCADARLYALSDPLNGMSSTSWNVEEDSGAEAGTQLYALAFDDKGPRTGARNEISLNTTAKAATVSRDTVPSFRVDLTLPYQSEAVRGEPLLEATRRAFHARGEVVATNGSAPVPRGARCEVRATPTSDASKCLVRIRCGSTMVYGAGTFGMADCQTQEGAVINATDTRTTPEGGDPVLALDVAAKKVVISDRIDAKSWEVTVTLEPRASSPAP